MTINYSFVLADSISRLNPFCGEISMELQQVCLVQHWTLEDETPHQILNFQHYHIYHGRSEKQKQVPVHLRNYWAYQDEPSIENGLTLKGERVITPKS